MWKAKRIAQVSEDSIMVHRYLHETDRVTPQSVFYQPARSASERLEKLMGTVVFDFPKDEGVLSQIVEMATGNGSISDDFICMDFFAGSAAFADAVMLQNAKDGRNRRFIAVQFPEPIREEDKEQKLAFDFCKKTSIAPNISQISKERIRRALKRVHKGNGELQNVTGFRAFRLTTTNIRRWVGTKDMTPEGYIKQMDAFADTLLPGWKAEDVIWEVAVREGFPLTATITPSGNAAPKGSWRVSDPDTDRAFTICLADHIDLASVKLLGLAKSDLFVCRDRVL